MKTITLFACIILSLQGYASEKLLIESPKVDKRVELLSIVFRLAENKEYNETTFKKYTDRVENQFNAYKDHELIRFAKTFK